MDQESQDEDSKVFIRIMMCGASQKDWHKMSEIINLLRIMEPNWDVTGPTTEKCEDWTPFYGPGIYKE